jgi:hypothetical protein
MRRGKQRRPNVNRPTHSDHVIMKKTWVNTLQILRGFPPKI